MQLTFHCAEYKNKYQPMWHLIALKLIVPRIGKKHPNKSHHDLGEGLPWMSAVWKGWQLQYVIRGTVNNSDFFYFLCYSDHIGDIYSKPTSPLCPTLTWSLHPHVIIFRKLNDDAVEFFMYCWIWEDVQVQLTFSPLQDRGHPLKEEEEPEGRNSCRHSV